MYRTKVGACGCEGIASMDRSAVDAPQLRQAYVSEADPLWLGRALANWWTTNAGSRLPGAGSTSGQIATAPRDGVRQVVACGW
jgi:hypothetical protein